MIIKSLLDNDLYKFSMNFAILKLFSSAKVKYNLIMRSDVIFPDGFAEKLREEIKLMETLQLTKEEKSFFEKKCSYIDQSYFDFLEGYRFNSAEIGVIQNNGKLEVCVEGYWFRVVLWEVPLLALISELYFKMTSNVIYGVEQRHENNQKKAAIFNYSSIKVADFGTRRRYSFDIQKEMVEDLSSRMTKGLFVGTSNVYLAFLYNLTPIGTEAHEWFSFHAAKYGYKMANSMAMEAWVNVFRGDLGIALADTYTTDVFLRSFDTKMAKLFDGVRQDSGDPYEFADKVIAHYKSLGIDPMSKSIIFSDALDIKKACEIKEYCVGKIKSSFGIGTHLTNDVGVDPLNIVIKLSDVQVNGQWTPIIKLSDSIGKYTGKFEEIDLCKRVLKII